MMKKLPVEIWSDIACPWCYVGKRRFEAALAGFAHRDEIEVTWRAFELDPSAPRILDASTTLAERLATKYRMPIERAEAMMRSTAETARADGLDLRFDRVRGGNTFDGHRVLHLARARGRADAAKERLMRGYFTDGETIGDPETLVRLATEAGLDADEVRTMLAGDAYRREVRAEQAEARALGISGVPCFVIDRRYGVSGAQPAETLRAALTQAWDERPAAAAEADPEAPACGPDGCAT